MKPYSDTAQKILTGKPFYAVHRLNHNDELTNVSRLWDPESSYGTFRAATERANSYLEDHPDATLIIVRMQGLQTMDMEKVEIVTYEKKVVVNKLAKPPIIKGRLTNRYIPQSERDESWK